MSLKESAVSSHKYPGGTVDQSQGAAEVKRSADIDLCQVLGTTTRPL